MSEANSEAPASSTSRTVHLLVTPKTPEESQDASLPTPKKRGGRTKGSKLEISALRPGGHGGRVARSRNDHWMLEEGKYYGEHGVQVEDASSDDDSDFSASSTNEKNYQVQSFVVKL